MGPVATRTSSTNVRAKVTRACEKLRRRIGSGRLNSASHLQNAKAYRMWFISDTSAAFGASLQSLSFTLIAFGVAQSASAAGLLATLYAVVMCIASLFGGVYVDWYDRRTSIAGYALIQGVLWAALSILAAIDVLDFGMLVAAAVVCALVQGALGGATDALLRSIVGDEGYLAARSANEARDALISMAGSSIAGACYGLGASFLCFVKTLVHALGFATAVRLPVDEERVGRGHLGGSAVSEFICAVRWLVHEEGVLPLVLTAGLLNFSFVALQYGAQLQMLDEGIESLWVGVAEGVMCAGMFLGSARMARVRCPESALAPVAVTACALVAVSAVWMGVSSYASMVLGLAAVSFCFPAASIAVVSRVYLSASDAMQGRARSLVVLVTQMLSALAMALAGQLLDMFGLVSVSLAAACAAVAAFAVCVCAARTRAGSSAR